jgi:hypothetical protein
MTAKKKKRKTIGKFGAIDSGNIPHVDAPYIRQMPNPGIPRQPDAPNINKPISNFGNSPQVDAPYIRGVVSASTTPVNLGNYGNRIRRKHD